MRVVVGQGSCGVATGARKTAAEFEKQIEDKGLGIDVSVTGCVGTCYLEPIVDVYEDDGSFTRYVQVQPENVEKIVDEHLKGGKVVDEQDLDIIRKALEKLSTKYERPVVTELLPLANFTIAEEYHQDYLIKNPDGYCHVDRRMFDIARNYGKNQQ